ncbi:MAG: hypothetical protein F6K48_12715 [Okeania sp. SIO3H1]|uniref:DUF6464 family protein n=1 Tax=Okeania sp. SIO1I7 TaxID=2607772 RepID=UPI0013CA0839|nr:DUF6464 family protein [Okeania sp. SIO1I7]NEN89716.1 hypothetical protein [Okeania sp. SIO3H1]NET25640.1 hypothetical protein [Okeania sp. SIO1I7]
MFKILLIFLIGMTPWIFSLWILHKFRARTRQRLISVRLAGNYTGIPTISSQPEQQYIDGLGYIIGDLSCKFNARSPLIRCAVNPFGPCKYCSDYESIDISAKEGVGSRE